MNDLEQEQPDLSQDAQDRDAQYKGLFGHLVLFALEVNGGIGVCVEGLQAHDSLVVAAAEVVGGLLLYEGFRHLFVAESKAMAIDVIDNTPPEHMPPYM